MKRICRIEPDKVNIKRVASLSNIRLNGNQKDPKISSSVVQHLNRSSYIQSECDRMPLNKVVQGAGVYPVNSEQTLKI